MTSGTNVFELLKVASISLQKDENVFKLYFFVIYFANAGLCNLFVHVHSGTKLATITLHLIDQSNHYATTSIDDKCLSIYTADDE